jgi:hypothetical protein
VKHKLVYRALLVLACAFVLISSPNAQQGKKGRRLGFPQDWTQRHLLYTHDALMKNPRLLSGEPRLAYMLTQRWLAHNPQSGAAQSPPAQAKAFKFVRRDWNVNLGLGRIAPNMFPAKFSLDPNSQPDCTNDYVVMGLGRVGTATQANLVGFNQLYSGPGQSFCNSATPNVMFAYNITTVTPGGRVITSPVLSLDGKKIAFVESSPSGNVFHVLTWAAGEGGITTPVKPGDTGVVGTMTSLPFATVVDTRSSPWVDYNNDVAYVGADDGNIYKISPVFSGTPALAGAPWPVAVSPNVRPSSPVLDHNLGLVMVGSQNGTFHSIDTTSGSVKTLVVGVSGGTNPGVLAPPIVDVTNGISFVVSSNDGTSGVLVEADTATMTRLAKAQIGLASQSGTAVNLFQPAFSDAYFNDPTTGVARLCGTGAADITPWQYAFGFTLVGGQYILNTTPSFSAQLLNSTNARCTGWTEFFNANAGAGGTDFFFFGLTADCTGTGTSGCVVSRTSDVSLTTVNVTGGPSGIVVDNNSAQPQASSIYLTGAQAPNTAYKFTQSGLN